MWREIFEGLRTAARIVGFVAVLAVAMLSSALAYHVHQMGLPQAAAIMDSASPLVGCSGKARDFVPFARIPPHVRDALLAAQEPEFFRRPPIDAYSKIMKSLVGAISGSPTRSQNFAITRAIVRCILHAHRDGWHNGDWHLANVVLLHRIERDLDRERIFEIFANETYFGCNAFGLSAAAEACFGKPLGAISMAEAATIAAAVKSPSDLKRPSVALVRRNAVLDRMAEAGFLARDLAEGAKATPMSMIAH